MENLSAIENFKNSPSIKKKVSVCFASSYKAASHGENSAKSDTLCCINTTYSKNSVHAARRT